MKLIIHHSWIAIGILVGGITVGHAATLSWTTVELPDRLDRPLTIKEVLAVASARLDMDGRVDTLMSGKGSLADLREFFQGVPPYLLVLGQSNERLVNKTEEWFARMKREKNEMEAGMGLTPALKERSRALRKAYLNASSWEEMFRQITTEDKARWKDVGHMLGYESFEEMQRAASTTSFLSMWRSHVNGLVRLDMAKGLIAMDAVDQSASSADFTRRIRERWSDEEMELMGGVPLKLSVRDGASMVSLKEFSDLNDDQWRLYRERIERIRKLPRRRSANDVSPSALLAKSHEAFEQSLSASGKANPPASGQAVSAWMGVMVKTAKDGVEVTRVTPGGPADKAKIVKGDRVLSIEKKP